MSYFCTKRNLANCPHRQNWPRRRQSPDVTRLAQKYDQLYLLPAGSISQVSAGISVTRSCARERPVYPPKRPDNTQRSSALEVRQSDEFARDIVSGRAKRRERTRPRRKVAAIVAYCEGNRMRVAQILHYDAEVSSCLPTTAALRDPNPCRGRHHPGNGPTLATPASRYLYLHARIYAREIYVSREDVQ